MEGEGGPFAWWSMEGEGGPFAQEKEKVPLHLLPLPPKQIYLNPHFLSFDTKVLPYHGPRPFFTHSLPFLAYKLRSHNLMSQIPSTFIAILFLLKIFPLFLASMASRVHSHLLQARSRTNE